MLYFQFSVFILAALSCLGKKGMPSMHREKAYPFSFLSLPPSFILSLSTFFPPASLSGLSTDPCYLTSLAKWYLHLIPRPRYFFLSHVVLSLTCQNWYDPSSGRYACSLLSSKLTLAKWALSPFANQIISAKLPNRPSPGIYILYNIAK